MRTLTLTLTSAKTLLKATARLHANARRAYAAALKRERLSDRFNHDIKPNRKRA